MVPAETESTMKILLEHHRELDAANLPVPSEEQFEETDMHAECE